ncbi:hypothetical protein QRE66_08705 [Bacillus cereus]|nr:hypothetical protein QRE66_08705 [Bacillus cereus]
MCALCNGTGIIRKETYPGVIETNGCTCEMAIQQQESYQNSWEAWLQYSEMEMRKVEAQKQQQAS